MKQHVHSVPADLALRAELLASRPAQGLPRVVELLKRTTFVNSSSFPCEVVDVRLADGALEQLFCKYEAGYAHPGFGHRHGVSLEAEVYRRILAGSGLSLPRYFGHHHADDGTWLFLEFMDGAERLARCPEGCLALAARWIGAFHAYAERFVASPSSWLTRYDHAYFLGWLTRTAAFASPLGRERPWLEELLARADVWIERLIHADMTVLHGEYYPKNVLIREGVAFPVDWESAAIGPGVVDLAALIDNWSAESAEASAAAYVDGRWPLGAPDGFRETLAAARMYVHLRWLGTNADRTMSRAYRWRFGPLRTEAERLGLL